MKLFIEQLTHAPYRGTMRALVLFPRCLLSIIYIRPQTFWNSLEQQLYTLSPTVFKGL